jgi:di/tripeptidase
VDYFLTVDLERYRLVNRAPGSYRYEVSFSGPGGHAFEAFGMPNPVHAAGRAVAALADLSVPKTPKTTFNVGVIRGGTAVNAIADSVAFLLELRSESPSALKGLDSAIRSIVGEAADAERRRWPESHVPLRSEVRLIGDRPAGEVPDSAWILRSARATAGLLGITIEPGAASTDANLLISLGIPALAMGAGGESEGAHSLGEWYRDGPQGWKAIQWAILLATRLSAGPGGNP